MTRQLVYTESAEADLDEIFDFIAVDNPRRARSYIEEIRQACRDLCKTPLIGVERSDIRPGLRIFPLWGCKPEPAKLPGISVIQWVASILGNRGRIPGIVCATDGLVE